jgi:NAD+ kinase
MSLSVKIVENGEIVSQFTAVNDAVISSGFMSRLIDISAYIDDEPISYRADGLIISSPTGSTAYSMSAGGAVVDPSVPCFCVTPICPHSFGARPLIFSDSATLEVRNVCAREKMLYLTVDGRMNFELYRNQTVRITKSDLKTNLIRLTPSSFYSNLRAKMRSTQLD